MTGKPRASRVVRLLVKVLVEGPARRVGPEAQADALAASARPLEARLRKAAADGRTPELLRHLIGIERWGQTRLRVALGDAPFVRDEHHPYKPGPEADVEALLEALLATRAETVALARRVAAEGKARVAVEHNAVGDLSAGGWLRYLRLHADLESRRVKG